MNVDDRTERLRVLLDPWCEHDDTALDAVDAADVALALACVEARRDALDAAWDALAIVLDTLARYRTDDPNAAAERLHEAEGRTAAVRFVAAALTTGHLEPHTPPSNPKDQA